MVLAVATKALIVRDDSVLRLWKSDAEAAVGFAPDERWDLPGGRLRLGESPVASLHREVLEETSLQVEILGPGFVWHRYLEHEQFQLVGITFVCRHVLGDVCLSPEHSDFRWVALRSLPIVNWKESEIVLTSVRRYLPASALGGSVG